MTGLRRAPVVMVLASFALVCGGSWGTILRAAAGRLA